MTSTDTTIKKRVLTLVRKLLVLKLGGDIWEFSGWKIFAFNGGTGPVMATITANNLTYRVDVADILEFDNSVGEANTTVRYNRIDDLPDLTPNDSIFFSAGPKNSPLNYALVATYRNANGFVTEGIAQSDVLHFIDTLATPADDQHLWNLILVRSFVRGSGRLDPLALNWFIPYRLAN